MTQFSTISGVPGALRPPRKYLVRAGLGVVMLGALAVPLIYRYWPFRYRNIRPLLEAVLASKVTIDQYHLIFFPHPGFVAEGLTLRRNTAPDLPPIGSAQDLVVQTGWLDILMLHKRVLLVDVKGLHIIIAPVGSRGNHADFPPGSSRDFAGPKTPVDVFHLQDAMLEILRTDGGRYSYPIRDLRIENLRIGQAVSYTVDMQNAYPTGRIQATGSFGPITPKNLGGTPLSGKFTFSQVHLGEIGKLHGTLSGQGEFSGALAGIEAYATSDTPDFSVGRGRPVEVAAAAQSTINGLNTDIVLHRIEVKTGKTVVHAGGDIMGSPKVTDLDMTVMRGRAEDLLRPFLHDQVPITGVVWMKGHAHLAPSGHGAKFLQRLRMDGRFNVPAERLTNPRMEKQLTAFSQRAQSGNSGKSGPGEPEASGGTDAVSSLEGRAVIRNGVLSTRRVTFVMPGATADLNGTFNFHGGAVHLLGDVKMDSDISHVTTGFKSMLLKPLVPFFKRQKAGAVIPIAVTGVPHRYKVSQNLLHTK